MLLAFLTSFVTTLGLVPLVRRIALQRGWVAEPKPDRWNQKPTALMGGVAIWAAVLAGMTTVSTLRDPIWGILLGGSVLFAAAPEVEVIASPPPDS